MVRVVLIGNGLIVLMTSSGTFCAMINAIMALIMVTTVALGTRRFAFRFLSTPKAAVVLVASALAAASAVALSLVSDPMLVIPIHLSSLQETTMKHKPLSRQPN